MPKSYTAEELEKLKALFMQSKYVSISYFLKKADPEFYEHITSHSLLNPLMNWEDEKQAYLMAQHDASLNLTSSYKANLKSRMDLTTYIQERLLEETVNRGLDLKDLERVVMIMDSLSKIQDRTAVITNSNATSLDNVYNAQKEKVDSLLESALKELGDPDELDSNSTDE